MVENTVRVTSPSRSNPRRVSDSMRCEKPTTPCRNSLNRHGPSRSSITISTLDLSPMRFSIALIPDQSP
jgi:hypothetical protein